MTTEGGGPASPAAPATRAVVADAATLDALRRRVYAPDADADDVTRYARELERARARATGPDAALQAAPHTAGDGEGPSSPDPDPPSGRRAAESIGAAVGRRRRRTLVIGAAATVVVVGLALALAQRTAAPTARPLPAPTMLTVDAADRAAFLSDLDGGRTSGLVRWLAKHPEAGPAVLNGRLFKVDVSTGTAVEVHTDEFAGTGTQTVSLLPPTAAARTGGRATVFIVLGKDAEVTWTLATLALYPDRTVHLRAGARRAGPQQAGVPTAATVTFSAENRPLRLTVAVPKGVRWEAVLTITG